MFDAPFVEVGLMALLKKKKEGELILASLADLR
jgi:hypothetical protein